MPEEHCELGRIHWSETFPFIRLFSTFKRAVSFWPLVLAFSCVIACYVSGRVLDAIWKAADAGVLVAGDRAAPGGVSGRFVAMVAPAVRTEIEAYAEQDARSFQAWKQHAAQRWEQAEAEGEGARAAEQEQQLSEMLTLIAQRLEIGLTEIDADGELGAREKDQQREGLRRAADMLRLMLHGYDTHRLGPERDQAMAIETVLAADPEVSAQQVAEEQARLAALLAQQQRVVTHERLRPRGPFMSLLYYEMDCFAAAIQGVCSGRWGLSGSALSAEPAMIGSIASAASGIQWLVTQRPWYALVLIAVLLAIFALFGGAICRATAVRSARDESMSFLAALRFSRQKFVSLLTAPLLPAGVFVFAGVLIFIGGLVAAIPYLETVAGVIYGLALLGGVALAFTFLAVVVGFHLMWPTIAVEGSDAFDAVQRAAGYVFQRPWHVAFYSFVLLLYGGVSFVIVRIIGMLLFKLAHVATGAGMNLVSSAQTSTIGKLDAIWQMPAWQDLPLLPALGDVNFWGDFRTVPLSGSESFAAFFIAFWVFLAVGLVGAFVVSFYFCGSTEMYFLLRREVDAVDYDEIYYEEPQEELPREEPPAPQPEEPEEREEPAEAEEPKGPAEPQEPEQPRKTTRSRKPKKAEPSEDEGPEEPAGDPPSSD
jgi:hypothetical protein